MWLCYAAPLGSFDVELQKNLLYLTKKKGIFHYTNSLALTSTMIYAKLVELAYDLLPHPLNSPGLATCHFYLFLRPRRRTLRTKCIFQMS